MTKVLILFLAVILSASVISAVGVANSYWDDKPLKLAPGESTTISLRLQNEETQQITMKATIDSQIASLEEGPEYIVPPNKVSVPVYIKVNIPNNAAVGTNYKISVSFQQISSGGEGMVSVAQGITSEIPVQIVGEQESEIYSVSETNNNLFAIIAVIAIALVIAGAYMYKKRK
ncbi:MAG: hypothetical protein NTW17_03275 [Candidatus Pacearchaeota archaeon]|nr:hypothetical protein [Candidatus Pacearchaeota archaeon]